MYELLLEILAMNGLDEERRSTRAIAFVLATVALVALFLCALIVVPVILLTMIIIDIHTLVGD